METLLESLAVLGKLGSALDIIAQRLPSEIFTLVETTLDEVGERAEYGRRGSMLTGFGGAGGERSDAVFVFSSGDANGTVSMSAMTPPKGGYINPRHLRLAALEPSAKRVDHETLKDFFWTVYSKLDAVTQGLRVVYEVSNRIGSVRVTFFTPFDLHEGVIIDNPFLCRRDETSRTHLVPSQVLCFRLPRYGCQSKPRYIQSDFWLSNKIMSIPGPASSA